MASLEFEIDPLLSGDLLSMPIQEPTEPDSQKTPVILLRLKGVDDVGVDLNGNDEVVIVLKKMEDQVFHRWRWWDQHIPVQPTKLNGHGFWRVATSGESAGGILVTHL